MKTIFSILLITIFSFAIKGCERDEPLNLNKIDCLYCYQDKPELGPLDVLLTINDENPYVPIVVYIGNIEDNNVEYIDTATSSNYYVDVSVNKFYSISAEYKSGNTTIFAIDGDEFKIKYSSDGCDLPCYYFSGGYFDVRLRN